MGNQITFADVIETTVTMLSGKFAEDGWYIDDDTMVYLAMLCGVLNELCDTGGVESATVDVDRDDMSLILTMDMLSYDSVNCDIFADFVTMVDSFSVEQSECDDSMVRLSCIVRNVWSL